MNNWWIAALENAGIWTREQAEHVSNNIRNEIHSDRYVDTFNTLQRVLETSKKFDEVPLIKKLEADIKALKTEVVSSKVKKVVKKA